MLQQCAVAGRVDGQAQRVYLSYNILEVEHTQPRAREVLSSPSV